MSGVQPSKKRRRRKAPAPQLKQTGNTMRMLAAIPTWVTFTVTIATTFIATGYTYANMEAKVERLRDDLLRNEREDRDRQDSLKEQIRQLNMQLNGMNQLRTDVEVMKNSLASISDTLRRLERRLEAPPVVPSTNP